MICRGLILNFILFFGARVEVMLSFLLFLRHWLLHSNFFFYLFNQPIFLNFFLVKLDPMMSLAFWVVFFFFNFSSCAHK